MRRKQNKNSAWVLVLFLLGSFTFAFQFWAIVALAQDADSDGFIDTLEGTGFTLTTGMQMATHTGDFVTLVPKCVTNSIRQNCVDPAAQDFFVIMQRATSPCPASPSCGDPCGQPLFGTSDIAPPLEYPNVYGSSLGPLQWVPKIATGFATHEIRQTSGTSTQVTPGGWHAVKIIEDLNPCSTWFGISTPGTITPVAPGSATVWPEKIMNWTDKACSQACFTNAKTGVTTCYYVPVPGVPVPNGYSLAPANFYCKNANNTSYQVDMRNQNDPNMRKLYNDFIKNVISHEASHLMHLAFGPGTSADNHWPQASGTLMEQFIGAKAAKDSQGNITVTLYISDSYARQDPAQHALK